MLIHDSIDYRLSMVEAGDQSQDVTSSSDYSADVEDLMRMAPYIEGPWAESLRESNDKGTDSNE